MNRKSFLKINFIFIIFFINKMLFATTIEKKIFFSAYLKGINLAKAEGQIKIKPNILKLYFTAQTVGIPVKDAGTELEYYKYLGGEKITNLSNLSESLTLAARHALIQMIDYIVDEHGLSREQAYILCSVAVDLRVGQVVDVPNYVITAVLNLDVFDKNRN